MVLDASAVIAIIASEDDAQSLSTRLGDSARTYMTAIAFYESTLGLARTLNIAIEDAMRLTDRFVQELGTEIVPIDDAIGRVAIEAFGRFGKGRHRAALNMGDCFAYACAKVLEVPLLFKGGDFTLTDIETA
jgi:ribonuclease VapC